jgi:hypothetical protein
MVTLRYVYDTVYSTAYLTDGTPPPPQAWAQPIEFAGSVVYLATRRLEIGRSSWFSTAVGTWDARPRASAGGRLQSTTPTTVPAEQESGIT